MKLALLASAVAIVLWLGLAGPFAGAADVAAPPGGLQGEQSLPERHAYVVQDMLKLCRPRPGFWVDLGAGEGQVAIPLIEATGNAVVMLEPKMDDMIKGLQVAREKKLENRLAAVVGVAESLPFPDSTVDLVVSRGSIFFWNDPVQGLREVQRVLRPGGKAYIGGGAGSGYPKWAVDKLIQERKEKMQGDEADKWKRFVELRRPEQMKDWATQAGLQTFRVLGQGAICADDEHVGQGVWLLFAKH